MKDQPQISQNASLALAQLRLLIARELPADGRLPTERALTVRLGVGRRAVRRALDALEAEGLVWRRQGRGTFAGQPPDPADALLSELAAATDIASVMEARLALEPALAELAARRVTAEDAARLRLLAERTGAAPDSDAAELWDGALHRMIARIAANRLLLAAFALIDEVRVGADWQEQRHRLRTPETLALVGRQHDAVVAAIAAGDGARARTAMEAHLQSLIDRLEPDPELDGPGPESGVRPMTCL